MRCAVLGCVVAAVMAAPVVVAGQWIEYPTEGLPRNADGSLNRNAPTPRLPDGRPDFSGLWHAADPNRCKGRGGEFARAGTRLAGRRSAATWAGTCPAAASPIDPGGHAGRCPPRRRQPRRSARPVPARQPASGVDAAAPTKAIHGPKLLVLLYEINAMYRQIFIDGRPLPAGSEPGVERLLGRAWEGDTLVVETRGFRDDLWIDTWGSPMSAAATMTERISRPNVRNARDRAHDRRSEELHAAFTVKLAQNSRPDTELIDEFCLENGSRTTG